MNSTNPATILSLAIVNTWPMAPRADTLLVNRDDSIDSFLRDFFQYPGARAAWNAGSNYDPDWVARVQIIYDRTTVLASDEIIEYEFPWLGLGPRALAQPAYCG
jgi:hypothetical protein